MAAKRVVPRLLEVVKPKVGQSECSAGFKPLLMENLARKHKLLSIPTTSSKNVAHIGGDRSYVMLGSLARLEQALMDWTQRELIEKYNFRPVIVPNILHDHIIESCGFPTKSVRSQVYKISGSSEEFVSNISTRSFERDKALPCIAGTSEFALASIHIGDAIAFEDLPKRYCALSQCYRAESSSISSEWGIYRVHHFKKVEMFAFTMPDESARMHEDFLNIQKDLFKQLDLHFQVLEMPEDDLGLSAKKKYDIEAWMGGRERYGEISSTSNCEDYQSSHLNITYSKMVERDNQLQIDKGYVHTINGTACSSARTLIALFEQHQTEDGKIRLPDVLVPYMNGTRYLPTKEDINLLKEVELYPNDNLNVKEIN